MYFQYMRTIRIVSFYLNKICSNRQKYLRRTIINYFNFVKWCFIQFDRNFKTMSRNGTFERDFIWFCDKYIYIYMYENFCWIYFVPNNHCLNTFPLKLYVLPWTFLFCEKWIKLGLKNLKGTNIVWLYLNMFSTFLFVANFQYSKVIYILWAVYSHLEICLKRIVRNRYKYKLKKKIRFQCFLANFVF